MQEPYGNNFSEKRLAFRWQKTYMAYFFSYYRVWQTSVYTLIGLHKIIKQIYGKL